ncbi:MAG: hypothetical protein WBP12_03535 [Candidatus Saccharimonas sp.]
MTEQRPHFRSKNSLHPRVVITHEEKPLTQKERERIQYSNMPDTTFGRAALACYDGIDTGISESSANEEAITVGDLRGFKPELPQD